MPGGSVERLGVAVNLELLRVRAGEIRHALAQLRPIASLTPREFADEADRRDAALYRLLLAIEAAMGICTHLSAHLPTRVPGSLPDCFRALSELDVLSAPLAERLGHMARFRNLLVHRYWELDYGRVLGFLQGDVQDLETYLQAIGTHVGADL